MLIAHLAHLLHSDGAAVVFVNRLEQLAQACMGRTRKGTFNKSRTTGLRGDKLYDVHLTVAPYAAGNMHACTPNTKLSSFKGFCCAP